MKSKNLLLSFLLFILAFNSQSQIKIGNNPNTINSNSLFEMESTTKGFLLPRMTLSQKNAIVSPPTGLLIYQTDGIQGFYYYDGSIWQMIGAASSNYWSNSGNNIYNNNSGNVAIGTSTFDAINPEKFLVNAGTTSSFNALVARGTINNYFQLNVRNLSNGTTASSDVVATADNGTDTTMYIDMGVNGSGYTAGYVGGANDAYFYGAANNLDIGNVTPGKDIVFFSNGSNTSTNERMRLTSSGYIGIGISTPQSYLHIHNSTTSTGSFPLLQLSTGFTGSNSTDGFVIGLENTSGSYNVQFKTLETGSIEFYGGASEVLYVKSSGSVGVGNSASSPKSTLQVGGSFALPITTKTSNYTATTSDYTILCNTGSMVLNLPQASNVNGRIYVIKKISSSGGTITIIPNSGSETIDGLTTNTFLISQWQSITLQSTGSTWVILSKF